MFFSKNSLASLTAIVSIFGSHRSLEYFKSMRETEVRFWSAFCNFWWVLFMFLNGNGSGSNYESSSVGSAGWVSGAGWVIGCVGAGWVGGAWCELLNSSASISGRENWKLWWREGVADEVGSLFLVCMGCNEHANGDGWPVNLYSIRHIETVDTLSPTRVSFGWQGGALAPPCQSLAPPWKSQVANFFKRVIGRKGYRTNSIQGIYSIT